MASGIYTRFKANLWKKLHDLVNDTVKVALYQNSFSFTATDTAYTTTGELLGVNGYTAGGATLANKAVTEGTLLGKWDADDPSWNSFTASIYHAVMYDVTPCNTLIAAIDLGGVQTVTNGTFSIQFASSGIIVLV